MHTDESKPADPAQPLMTDVRKADPGARRQALLIQVLGTCLGAALILAFERYPVPLSDWVLADPASALLRARLLLWAVAPLQLAPLPIFGVYLWRWAKEP